MWKSCKNLTIIFALSCIGGNIFYMLGDWRVTHDFLLCSHSAHKEAVEPHGGVLSANLSILSKQLSVRKWDSSRWVAHTRVKKISVNSSPVSFFIYNPTIPNTTFSITAEKRKKEEKKKNSTLPFSPIASGNCQPPAHQTLYQTQKRGLGMWSRTSSNWLMFLYHLPCTVLSPAPWHHCSIR